MKLALAIEAACVLLAARVATRTVRFITVARALGWSAGVAPQGLSAADQRLAKETGDAVTAASRMFLFKDACLAEAIAGKWMLSRRGVQTTLHMGMAVRGSAKSAPRLDPDAHVILHAWLDADSATITGSAGRTYKSIASYY
jgi:hypothetical protein